MARTIQTFLNLILAVAVASCSLLKPEGKEARKDPVELNKDLTVKEVQALNEESAKRVSAQLKKLAIAAKASGEEKVRFLASDMFLKASAAQMEGDHRTANIIFESLVDLVPDDIFVLRKYAVGLIRMGELAKAESILESIVKMNKVEKNQDSDIALVLAGVYTSLGKTKKAQEVYAQILAQDKTNEDACIFLSKTHILEGKQDRARKVLNQCEKRIPGKGIFSYYIGKMLVDEGKLKEAKKHFKRASKIEPGFSQAIMALGLVHEEQNKKEEAIKIYKKYLVQRPNDTLILSRMVQLMFSLERFQAATPFAERLSDLDPDDLNLKVKLGILYTDAKKYPKAISVFKELLSRAPANDKILYYLGAIYQETKEYENAVDYFSRVPTTSGLYQDSSLQAAQMLSALAQSQDDGKKAEGLKKDFLELVDSRTKDLPEMAVEFQVLKAGFFEAMEENVVAIEAMESVSKHEQFTDNHRYYLASLYEKEGDYDSVLPIIEGILKRNPDDAYAYNFLGYSLLEKGERLDEAFDYISKAVELKPEDGYIRDSLGWYYFKTGDIDKALTELAKAAKAVPNDVSIQKHLAIVYGKLRQYGKAKRYINTAIGLAKFESERLELREVLQDLDAKRIPASD